MEQGVLEVSIPALGLWWGQGTLVEGCVKDTCWLLTSHQWGQRNRRSDNGKTHLHRTQPHWPASPSALSVHLPIRLSCSESIRSNRQNPFTSQIQVGRTHSHLRFKTYEGTVKDYVDYMLKQQHIFKFFSLGMPRSGTSKSRWFLPNFPMVKDREKKKNSVSYKGTNPFPRAPFSRLNFSPKALLSTIINPEISYITGHVRRSGHSSFTALLKVRPAQHKARIQTHFIVSLS